MNAFPFLPSSLQLPEVFRPSLGDLLPTFPSKLDGGGILSELGSVRIESRT